MQRQRFEIEIAAIYDRCASAFGAIRLLLKHGFAHEALSLGRALYTESLVLEELAAADPLTRLKRILGWQLDAINDLLGVFLEAKSAGDTSEEIAQARQAQNTLRRQARENGITRLRPWKPDEKKLAQTHRAGDGYLDFRTSHHFVHGSAFAAGERYREVADGFVAVGGKAAQTELWAAPVGLAAALSVLKAADAAYRIFEWPGRDELDALQARVESVGKALGLDAPAKGSAPEQESS
jgi:hypothetical protein